MAEPPGEPPAEGESVCHDSAATARRRPATAHRSHQMPRDRQPRQNKQSQRERAHGRRRWPQNVVGEARADSEDLDEDRQR